MRSGKMAASCLLSLSLVASTAAATGSTTERSPLVSGWLIGGSEGDRAHDISSDEQGNIYITGITFSSDFPTKQAAQGESGGTCDSPPCGDAFVAKFTARGRLVYSTYLGGGLGTNSSGFDYGTAIWVDSAGNAYVTGTTHSPDFPTTPTAFKPQLLPHEQGDAFVTKLDPHGAIVYSTYLGGSMTASGQDGADEGRDIVADAEGNAYVVGYTSNIDFPIRGGFQATNAGAEDVFVAKLDPSGGQLLYSTYLGGESHDYGGGIAFADDSIFVSGSSASADFPITLGAYQGSFGGGFTDVFVTRLEPLDFDPVYSTFLGGSKTDAGGPTQVSPDGTVYVAGSTASSDFPTRHALAGFAGGPSDGFVAALSPDGGKLTFATYFGGPQEDRASDIALASKGGLYVTGTTDSANLVAKGGFQREKAGELDAFVAAFRPDLSLRMFTFLGGDGNDAGSGVVHRDGRIYVAGDTSSADFSTINSRRMKGPSDSFVVAIRGQRSQCSILGSHKDDRIFGTVADDVICGLDGDDLLVGRAGGDLFRGGGGNDLCRGESGKDSFVSCERFP